MASVVPSFKVILATRTVTVDAISFEIGYRGGYEVVLDNINFSKLLCLETVTSDVLYNYIIPGARQEELRINLKTGQSENGDNIYTKFITTIECDRTLPCKVCGKDFYSDEVNYVRKRDSEFWIEGKTEEYSYYCKECYKELTED